MMTILFRSNKRPILTALIFSVSLLIPLWCVGQTESSVRSSANEFHPGELWYDTSGTPIDAHGGGFLYPFCPRPGFQKRLGQLSQRPTAEFSTQAQFFAEFFAELRAIGTPNPPLYAVANMRTAGHKAKTRRRVVKDASRQLRKKGLNGPAVATLMKASGLIPPQ